MDRDMDLTFLTRCLDQKPIDFGLTETLNGGGRKIHVSLFLLFIPVNSVMGEGQRCLPLKWPFQYWSGFE
jgi:hypothetical protein